MILALNDLLKELEQAYKISDIRKYCETHHHQWFYSLATTTLEKDGPMIIGFNWGALRDEMYLPQTEIVKSDFSKGDVGSLSRIFPYIEKYLGVEFLSRATQTNFCFFRSKKESDISNNDIRLCEPIFERLMTILKPSSIICLSSKLRDYMINNNKISEKYTKIITFKRGSSEVTYECIKATLNSGAEICFLPHPNYPITSHARNDAWDFCYGKTRHITAL